MQVVYIVLAILLLCLVVLLLWHKRQPHKANAASAEELEWDNYKVFTLAAEYFAEGKTFTLLLPGFSMRPFLENKRDYGVLEAVKPEEVKVGDVVLAEYLPKRYALHRVIKIDGENFDMLGDGNITPEHCKLSDIRAIAIGFYRKGRKKMDSVNGRKWKIYSALWMKLRPIRRYLLFIYRRYFKIKCITTNFLHRLWR